jgi:Glycolipid 2-alpha-mannosyltransferase/Nucleotide-diphospho-sugar transferase
MKAPSVSFKKLPMEQRSSRARGAIIYLTDGSESKVSDLKKSLQYLDTYCNDRFHFPIIIFSTLGSDQIQLTQSQKLDIQKSTRSLLNFTEVDFGMYEAKANSQPNTIADPEKLSSWPVKTRSIGYRNMCYFFSGPIAFHPALQSFEYFWRLDSDSFLLSSIDKDPFLEMKSNGWKYGYITTQCDWHVVTEGISPIVEKSTGVNLGSVLPPAFSDSSCKRGSSNIEQQSGYNNRIFYNNFEFVDLSVIRSKSYQSAWEKIDEAGGIYSHRWGDAPIRTMLIHSLLPASAIHQFHEMSYYHTGFYGLIVVQLYALALLLSVLLLCVSFFRCYYLSLIKPYFLLLKVAWRKRFKYSMKATVLFNRITINVLFFTSAILTVYLSAHSTSRYYPLNQGTTCFPHDLECLLELHSDSEKRIVVTCVSSGAIEQSLNLAASLQRLNINNMLFFPLDPTSVRVLKESKIPYYHSSMPIDLLNFQSASPFSPSLSGELFDRIVGGSLFRGIYLSNVVLSEFNEKLFKYALFDSTFFASVTQRKNEIVYEVLKLGYNPFFTDSDTVWMENPFSKVSRLLQHPCNGLRLGDAVSAYADDVPNDLVELRKFSPCNGTFNYDVIGMYGDTGGLDTGYWFIKSNERSLGHLREVVLYQRENPHLNDQVTFNDLLVPWKPDERKSLDEPGFGKFKLRTALFDPFVAPSGCRYDIAVSKSVQPAVIHANCRSGALSKFLFLFSRGRLFCGWWDDKIVFLLASFSILCLYAGKHVNSNGNRISKKEEDDHLV